MGRAARNGIGASSLAHRSGPTAVGARVAEWLYLDWSSRAEAVTGHFVYVEWIVLHDNPDFRDFIGFLRAELDRIGRRAGGFVPRLFSSGCRLELFFSKPPTPTGPDTKVFDRVKAEPEGDRGFESGLLQRGVHCEPGVMGR